MKHVTSITKTAPAKAESLLAKAQLIENIGAAVSVASDLLDITGKND